MVIKRNTDKRTCFKTGNSITPIARQTGKQVADSQKGAQEDRVRHSHADSETGFGQGDKEI